MIKKIDGLEEKFDKKIDGLENKFDEKMDNLENRFDSLESNFNEFKQETKQSFTEVKQELRFMNRKMDVQIEDLLNTKVKVRDYEEIIRVLEEEKEVA